jgi:hypothetical protein
MQNSRFGLIEFFLADRRFEMTGIGFLLHLARATGIRWIFVAACSQTLHHGNQTLVPRLAGKSSPSIIGP